MRTTSVSPCSRSWSCCPMLHAHLYILTMKRIITRISSIKSPKSKNIICWTITLCFVIFALEILFIYALENLWFLLNFYAHMPSQLNHLNINSAKPAFSYYMQFAVIISLSSRFPVHPYHLFFTLTNLYEQSKYFQISRNFSFHFL